MSGNANVKNAAAGIAPEGRVLVAHLTGDEPADGHRRRLDDSRPDDAGAASGVAVDVLVDQELQVGVLERRPGDRQVLEHEAGADGPARQLVHELGRLVGAQLDRAIGRARRPTAASASGMAGAPVGYPHPDAGSGRARVRRPRRASLRATIRPSTMTASRSARTWASSMKWVVSSTVRPDPVEPLDHVPGLPAGRRVEARRGLIEEQQLRVAAERDRQVQPAPLAARQSPHPGHRPAPSAPPGRAARRRVAGVG